MIGVDELMDSLSSFTILDVRYRLLGPPARADYEIGHVPGAHFVDLDRELASPPGEHGRHPLPESDVFEAAMRRCRVQAWHPVVCYDFADSSHAARAWWLLRYFGHDEVAVLDGGYAAWRGAGGEETAAEPADQTGDFVARAGHLPVIDSVAAATIARQSVLLDARTGERFRGESEPIDPVAGHIPGAVSAPTLENVDATGHFLDGDRLRNRFAALGVQPGAAIGSYCGSGITAAHQIIALELAGFEGAGL